MPVLLGRHSDYYLDYRPIDVPTAAALEQARQKIHLITCGRHHRLGGGRRRWRRCHRHSRCLCKQRETAGSLQTHSHTEPVQSGTDGGVLGVEAFEVIRACVNEAVHEPLCDAGELRGSKPHLFQLISRCGTARCGFFKEKMGLFIRTFSAALNNQVDCKNSNFAEFEIMEHGVDWEVPVSFQTLTL